MASEDFIEAVSRASEGTKMPRAQWEFAERIQQQIPPLPEQRAIAAVLGALDDKIELNRRMNRTLEAIAQAVFRHWFVENEEAEGWKIGDVSYFAQVRSGERPMTTKKIADAEYKYPLFGGGGIMAYTNKSLYDSPILLTGRVGTLGGIFRISYPCWASDNTLVLIPLKPENYYYLYFHLKQIDFEMLNRGSTQPLLTQSDLQKIETPLPPDRLLGEFTRVVSPIFAKIDANEQQSRTLAALRDALLPKLMRGEVRVTVHE
jgi:type I restriction enzyme S subunit